MTVKFTDPDTQEEREYYTADEIAAVETAKTLADTNAAEAIQKYEDLSKIHSTQADNFKRYKDMDDKEKAGLSAEKTELLKRIDETAAIADQANAKLAEREQAENDSKKATLVNKYTGGDKDLAAKFTEKFDSLTTVADLDERAKAAAVLAGIGVNPGINPLNQSFGPGESPRSVAAKTEKDEFLASDKGKAGLAMMEDKK